MKKSKSKLLAVFALGFLIIGIFVLLNTPTKLSVYLESEVPETIKVKKKSGSIWAKDAAFFWELSHQPDAVEPMLAKKFTQADAADVEFIEDQIKTSFETDYVADPTGSLFLRSTKDFEVYWLISAKMSNSIVAVFHK
jgi:hypothetical protein